MNGIKWLFLLFLGLCFFAIPVLINADPEPSVNDLQERNSESILYDQSRHGSSRKKHRNRGHRRKSRPKSHSRGQSTGSSKVTYTYHNVSSSSSNPYVQRSFYDDSGKKLFKWDGKSYDIPGTKIITTKKTTKTTQVSQTDSTNPKITSHTYTYTYPTRVTSYRNTSTITSGSGVPHLSTKRIHWYNSSSNSGIDGGSRHGGSSLYNYDKTSRKIAGGEDYLKETEQGLSYDFEEEYDPLFAQGPILSAEDRTHPFVVRGIAKSKGFGQANSHPCDQSSCYPATGNLLNGRGDRLTATSTCGLYEKEKFCIVSHLKHRKKCFWCDSKPAFADNPRYSHRVQNIIDRIDRRTGRRSWWQSENGKESVSVQLDLEAEFHFTHLVITFRTFRPSAMLIERSYDSGRTWKVYQYFAYNCAESFPGIPTGIPSYIAEVVCVSRYSEVEPSTEGEVIFRVLPPNIPIDDPYSDEVQNLLKITNLRVNFTKLHTLGDQLLDTRPEIKEKYYYAIYDMVVRGSCSCYGHASRCLPLPGVHTAPDMVHGQCECTHNTKGLNCDSCDDFYNDLPWKPAVGKEINACKRCNCNNHATRCHFDENVYKETGQISGGVCDDCAHHTQGRNCEQCEIYYYQETSLRITDPQICQHCSCDDRGSIDQGICDSKTDTERGLVAGRCRCKKNVDGLKCSRCKAGFWNFTKDNPFGCEECSCNTLGTVNNAGCNFFTGECQCKRNVIGRDCNQCRNQHYGLSDIPEGCRPCNCDRGGSLDNDCDVLNGQCRCRPHVTGRRCEKPEQGYFVPFLNYLTYEAELAKGTENCQVVMREPYRDDRETTWTGIGFMRVFHGSTLEFEIEKIETTMDYDLVIKYEPQFRGESWDGVNVRIERPGGVDSTGPCGNVRPLDDNRYVDLSEYGRDQTMLRPVCLESGKRYKIILEFSRSNANADTRSASILIDSISLIPRAEQLPIYTGSSINDELRYQYQSYRCSEPFYSTRGLSTLPDVCINDHLDSIGYYVFGQAYSCQCDKTGSRSGFCDPYGGQCNCKTYVKGRRCDRCAPGTYNFGPEGCSSCECNSRGALDNFCDPLTGKCKCRPNTYGRQCNECQPGYWNFPDCRRCVCNGYADVCDATTGKCISCRDFTAGPNCALCQEGYYGDPRLEVGIACRQCPCPGTIDSRHSFADRCRLDSRTKDVVCECREGYGGSRCDICADNYYGNPEQPGGRCQSCECNNNTDISRPGNCDGRSGKCLKCLFNTDGFNCDRCRDGYFGDAFKQECRECKCNLLGTDQNTNFCNHRTGQCPCLPNVQGLECKTCIANHWKVASGVGCEPCGCDRVGSYSEQCNEYDGRCDCRPGFGGRKCDQCQANFFGNPRQKCLPCGCNLDGSATLQCDHETGQCQCLKGIGGFKCDMCARGYKGRATYCEQCGECFDNWDVILSDLKERTNGLIESASQVKQRGATGAYSYEFQSMQEKIADVEKTLLNANMSSHNLDELANEIKLLDSELKEKEKQIESLEHKVDNTSQRISLASNTLVDLRIQADELKNQVGDLEAKATQLQEANVEGALNLTRLAGERSKQSQVRVDYTQVIVSESERHRKQTENILIYKADRFNRTIQENEAALNELSAQLSGMEDQIPELNEQVCDKRGDPCDAFCGGAGCGKCGGLSCNEGLVNTAQLAQKFAEGTEDLLKRKEAGADELLRGISLAKQSSNSAYDVALMVLEISLNAQNTTATYKLKTQVLLDQVQSYFDSQAAKPEDIRKIAMEILLLDISLKPEQITELAAEISFTIQSLTNIEKIIEATRKDLYLANSLKERADRAKERAEHALDVAEKVVDALAESRNAQDTAEEAINNANDDIMETEGYLKQIANETTSAQEQANESMNDVLALDERTDLVQAEFKINERLLIDTRMAVDQASLTAQRASNEAKDLEDKYIRIEQQLELKSSAAQAARERADKLKRRANKLSSEASAKLELLKDLREVFETNEEKLTMYEIDISTLEERMKTYHEYILNKAIVYTTCTANTQ